MTRATPLALALAALLTACASSPTPTPLPTPIPTPTPTPTPSLGVTVGADKIAPYTPEQIRDATPTGRTYRYRIVRDGKPTRFDEMRFTRVDAQGADITSTSREEPGGGAASEPKTKTVTWAELRAHGEFPRAAVTVTDEATDTPAGHFACMVFTLKDPDKGEVSRFYFSREIPGAPVFYFTEKAGKRVMTATLIEHHR